MNNYDIYSYRIKNINGKEKYYVSFTDVNGKYIETEVTETVYCCLQGLHRSERNLVRSDERHIEQSEQSETTIYEKGNVDLSSTEDITFDNLRSAELKKAMTILTEKQRIRIHRYYWDKMTLQQIANVDNCAHQTISESIEAARKKIRKFMENT